MTFISWFNKSAFSDYESVGPEYLRGPLQDSHLIRDSRLWRYHIDRTKTGMNHGCIVNIIISP